MGDPYSGAARIMHKGSDHLGSFVISSLTIRHSTTYRYRRPVAFGEHRMMLRPHDAPGQRLLGLHLDITPKPVSLRFAEDAFGNHVAIAQFSGASSELRFESVVQVDCAHSVEVDPFEDVDAYPVLYSPIELKAIGGDIEADHPNPDNVVGVWARRVLPTEKSIGAFDLLKRLSHAIHKDFRYRRREERGVQTPVETLGLGSGTCRDFAMLMIAAARELGFAARFASGYLASVLDSPEALANGVGPASTHAWARIFLPGKGWVDFDPTSGTIGKRDLVIVAAVRDPRDAIPLYGTFFGTSSDMLGMDVAVSITPLART
jgi:transglutaminase-like putative cysteine protease